MVRNRCFKLQGQDKIFLVDELQVRYENERMRNPAMPKYGFWKFLDESIERGVISEMPHRFYGKQKIQ